MHEAPMPNISMLLAICAVSPAKYAFSIKYQIVRYRRPRPTTVIPITAPEENETRSAELRLFVAPVTVREFAAVAIFIPMKTRERGEYAAHDECDRYEEGHEACCGQDRQDDGYDDEKDRNRLILAFQVGVRAPPDGTGNFS